MFKIHKNVTFNQYNLLFDLFIFSQLYCEIAVFLERFRIEFVCTKTSQIPLVNCFLKWYNE